MIINLHHIPASNVGSIARGTANTKGVIALILKEFKVSWGGGGGGRGTSKSEDTPLLEE